MSNITKPALSKQQKLFVKDLYEKENLSSLKIAKLMNCSKLPILKALHELNATIRKEPVRKYTINKYYFDEIDTEEKAYWLGFLYADGCVFRRSLLVRLSSIDKGHLEKLKKCLDSNAPIKTGKQNSFGAITEYVILEINNAYMVNSLKRLGCIENKTHTLKYPIIEIVPEKFQYDFIRGFLDGDGSIKHTKLNKKRGLIDKLYEVSFTGTEKMLKGIQGVLKTNTIPKENKKKHCWEYRFGGNLQVIEILNKLYKNATVYLDRKYKIYNELKDKYSSELIANNSKYSSRLW